MCCLSMLFRNLNVPLNQSVKKIEDLKYCADRKIFLFTFMKSGARTNITDTEKAEMQHV